MTQDELADYMQFAMRLADAAGAASLPHFRVRTAVEDKGGKGGKRFDPVTQADRQAEQAMRALIRATYPEHGIFGEEQGHQTGTSPLTWVLDPIDGTRAFITGLPLWGTLVALNDGRRPVLGVMDQPFTRERFTGNGVAAWLNGRTLHVRECERLSEASLMCTSPDIFSNAEQRDAFNRVAARSRLTRYGGDCYAYCMVAAGYVDAVVEAGLAPYDVQALIPIVEGAGGVMTSWDGGDAQHGGAVVACGDRRLLQEILSMLDAG